METENPAQAGEAIARPESDALVRSAEDALDEMQTSDALRFFERAEAAGHDPDVCAAGRWTCHMLEGEFERAWKESDAIERRGMPDPHRFWDGAPFSGKRVILRCLHGLGDTIQFIRFAPAIRAEAKFLTVEAQPGLKTLLAESGLADEVITWGETEPEWNQQIEVNELPRIFRVTGANILTSVPYLFLPRARRADVCDWPRKLRVGLVWASSIYNPLRSVPLRILAPMFETPGVSFFSLQAGSACEELRTLSEPIENLCEHSSSVLETAERMSQMDLVISVDTMAAHLAGALGMPTWVLLPFACDWRWMKEREDSPWYPTMRLFRQANQGDWMSVLQRVVPALKNFAASGRHQNGSWFTRTTRA